MGKKWDQDLEYYNLILKIESENPVSEESYNGLLEILNKFPIMILFDKRNALKSNTNKSVIQDLQIKAMNRVLYQKLNKVSDSRDDWCRIL